MWCFFQDKIQELQNMGHDVGLEVVDNALLALQGEWARLGLELTRLPGFFDCLAQRPYQEEGVDAVVFGCCNYEF